MKISLLSKALLIFWLSLLANSLVAQDAVNQCATSEIKKHFKTKKDVLRKNENGESGWVWMVKNCATVDNLKYFLKMGPNINEVDADGNNALFHISNLTSNQAALARMSDMAATMDDPMRVQVLETAKEITFKDAAEMCSILLKKKINAKNKNAAGITAYGNLINNAQVDPYYNYLLEPFATYGVTE